MIVGIGVDIAKIFLAARPDRAGAGLGRLLFAQREHSGGPEALAGWAPRAGIRA
jgi:GNAT superfamily N-acetyltransferase